MVNAFGAIGAGVVRVMTDVEALLAAIREDPDNPVPWSIYSDWLQTQNDPNGELIALQLERARCTDSVRLAEIDDRIKAVYQPDGGIHARMSVDAAELEHPQGLRRKLIRNLTLHSTNITPQECAWLVRAALPLHTLHMSPIDSMQLRGVLEAYPRLLRLGIFGASSADAEIIAQTARRLSDFDAGRRSTVGDAGLASLANIATLRMLEIPYAQVGLKGIAVLLDRLPVEQLVLTGNALGDDGIAPICDAPTLRELAIEATGFTSTTIARIARSSALASLRRLRLGSYEGRSNLTPSDLQVLMDSPYLSSELTLELDGHALELVEGYRQNDFSPEFDGPIWESEPTGPITKRFRIVVRGLP